MRIINAKLSGSLLIAVFLSLSISVSTTGNADSLQEKLGNIVDLVVAADGSGDYLTVQEGINAVPDNSLEHTILYIKNGTYREKITVPSSKINLTIIGENVDSTIIIYNDYAGKTPEMNTFNSQTIEILPSSFRAMNLTFENDARPGGTGDGQNVAVSSYGDKTVFIHCRFISWQDTYYTGADGRHYFKDCFFEGAVDYIFGHTTTIFDSCQIHTVRAGGYKTAASTKENYTFGYVFFNCRLTSPPGVTGVYLGRPWKTYAQTVFFECIEYENIIPAGWKTWNGNENTCFYAEYKCAGPGSDTSNRAEWSHQLSDAQAISYTMENIFSKKTSTDFSADWDPDIESDSVYQALKSGITMFMDSVNLDADISSIKMNGQDFPDWDPDVNEYFLELPEGTTDMPLLEAEAANPLATVEIEYPDALPGFAEITILANDRASHRTYRIYLSVNSAATNALLDSIKVGGKMIENFDPEIFEYEVILPQGTSQYYGVTAYKQAPDSKVSVSKPASLPGTITIVVTAVDGTSKVYTIEASIATGLDLLSGEQALTIYCDLTTRSIYFHFDGSCGGSVEFKLFDLKGALLLEKNWPHILQGEYSVPIAERLNGGLYIYQVSYNDLFYRGKLLINLRGS
jgi:pectinesterase